jgi:hypothetical protein
MIINNKEIATRIRLGLMLIILIYVAILVLGLIYSWFKNNNILIYLSVLFATPVIFSYLKNFCYIYFNDAGPKVIIRFTALQPLTAGNYSIEFYKKDFVKYNIEKSVFGLRNSLIIFVRTPQGIAKFKPVSLSSLKKNEVKDIIDGLERLKK